MASDRWNNQLLRTTFPRSAGYGREIKGLSTSPAHCKACGHQVSMLLNSSSGTLRVPKYPKTKYTPNTIFTIPNRETMHTPLILVLWTLRGSAVKPGLRASARPVIDLQATRYADWSTSFQRVCFWANAVVMFSRYKHPGVDRIWVV